jgi:cation diffusion facilitator CzcD-associated flavoprotein CzcO
LADAIWMNGLRKRIEDTVKDPKTAEALKPWYRLLCKRPTFNDNYLHIFNQPNVSLIDTHGQGVERFTETGLVVDGVHYEVDCIVFATGFEVGTSFTRRSGFDITGRDGLKLSDAWANGMRTLHGCYSHGFPNLFHMGTGQNASHSNRTFTIVNQARHIVAVLQAARERGAEYVEADAEAQDEWAKLLRAGSTAVINFFNHCTPGYFNNEGKKSTGEELIANLYGPGPLEFDRMLERWRADGFAGLSIA